MRILQALQQDARRSLREVAKLAGVSTPTASAKVKALEAKGVVRGFLAALSPEALGEQVMVLNVRARPSEIDAVARALAAFPEVRACHVVGTGRILAMATLIDPAGTNEFLSRLSAVAEIGELEALPLLRSVKDLPLAIVDRGVALAVKCEFCGRRTKDEAVRLKVGEVTHFVCCESCKAGLAERMGRLTALAGKAKAGARLPMADR